LPRADQAKLVIGDHTIEQAHRGVKRVTRPMLRVKSFEATQSPLPGIELLHMITKRQRVVEAGQRALWRPHRSTLWPPHSPHRPGQRIPTHLHMKICDGTHMLPGSITTHENRIYKATFWPMCRWTHRRPHIVLDDSQALT